MNDCLNVHFIGNKTYVSAMNESPTSLFQVCSVSP